MILMSKFIQKGSDTIYCILYYEDFIHDWLVYGTFKSFGKCFIKYHELRHDTNLKLKIVKVLNRTLGSNV